ncbi:hypothetical protein R1flu_004216 [Riccia fluitans]|uniref:Uncharacterized protein n=1 Tax=Riccia fluitans TaxID=41844 RepID=A0ABD1YTM4_9MARC
MRSNPERTGKEKQTKTAWHAEKGRKATNENKQKSARMSMENPAGIKTKNKNQNGQTRNRVEHVCERRDEGNPEIMQEDRMRIGENNRTCDVDAAGRADGCMHEQRETRCIVRAEIERQRENIRVLTKPRANVAAEAHQQKVTRELTNRRQTFA